MTQPTALLTGASGFIGRHTAIALGAAGFHVRALSRTPSQARRKAPTLDWVQGDLESKDSLESAFAGATTAIYLYHAVGRDEGYAERETDVAERFREAADDAGVERIVYLGGVAPSTETSRHLESRLATGEILRRARATTIELRASMVIGGGSASFQLIRDLAVRAPIVLLPPWLDHQSNPVAICDIAPAIALTCRIPIEQSAWFDVPGPECLSHRALLGQLTRPLGTRLVARSFAAITPRLAAAGLAALSSVSAGLSRELVAGLTGDLRPSGPKLWDRIGAPELRPLRHAIVDAVSDEFALETPGPETRRRIAQKTVEWLKLAGVLPHV